MRHRVLRSSSKQGLVVSLCSSAVASSIEGIPVDGALDWARRCWLTSLQKGSDADDDPHVASSVHPGEGRQRAIPRSQRRRRGCRCDDGRVGRLRPAGGVAGWQQSGVQGHVFQVEDELLEAEGESQAQDQVHPKKRRKEGEETQYKEATIRNKTGRCRGARQAVERVSQSKPGRESSQGRGCCGFCCWHGMCSIFSWFKGLVRLGLEVFMADESCVTQPKCAEDASNTRCDSLFQPL